MALHPDDYHQEATSLIEKLRKDNPKVRALIIIDDIDNSVIVSTDPNDFTGALGLLKITEVRILEKEKSQFYKREKIQEILDEKRKNFEKLKKEGLN